MLSSKQTKSKQHVVNLKQNSSNRTARWGAWRNLNKATSGEYNDSLRTSKNFCSAYCSGDSL